MKFHATANGRRLTIVRIDEKRVRFELKAGGIAGRSISGTAYMIYDGDVEIESDEGIGYASDQFFFWADGLGKQGMSIRLSLFQPDRARVLEWGGDAVFEKAIMREAQSEVGGRADRDRRRAPLPNRALQRTALARRR